MKAFYVRICLSLIPVLGLAVFANESFGAGPATTQQAVTQVQTSLSEATLSWRGGWGYRGWGYGGWGYRGWGYGRGWGGYYGGYGYARPWIYSYPGYGYGYGYRGYYRPYYYSGYSYASPYQCCGGYGYSNYYAQPISCCSTYSYPAYYGTTTYSTPSYYTSSVITTPSYSPTVVYSSPSAVSGTTTYGSPTYSRNYNTTPIYSSSTVISKPTPIQTTTPATTTPVAPAPYPAPPAEINQQPSTRRIPQPVTKFLSVHSGYHVTQPPAPISTTSASPIYSPTVAYTSVNRHAAYAPASFHYSPLGQPVRLVSTQGVY